MCIELQIICRTFLYSILTCINLFFNVFLENRNININALIELKRGFRKFEM